MSASFNDCAQHAGMTECDYDYPYGIPCTMCRKWYWNPR